MAANEYYNTGFQQPPTQAYDYPPRPAPYQAHSPPTQYDTPLDPPRKDSSQDFWPSDPYDPGRYNTADPYREDIPLKQNAQQPPQVQDPHWMQTSPAFAQEPMDPELSGERRRRKRRGGGGFFGGKKFAWFTWLLTFVDIGVFVGELVESARLTKSPIQVHPEFNPMIGPSPQVLIYMGARYVPCMKNVPNIQNNTREVVFRCPNSTSTDPDDPKNHCSLSDVCGFSGVPNPKPGGSLDDKPAPNQWFRFLVPMFLHGGVIHLGFNMLMQVTIGADMERAIGWWRFALVYFASGIFGFVMGGNFAGQATASTGASGCLFGIIAIVLLDLFYTWSDRARPFTELIFMLLAIGVSFVLGLLPGLDNFSHIGGFIMGLAMGLSMMRSPNFIRERIGLGRTPYVPMRGTSRVTNDAASEDRENFNFRRPLVFFQGRKPLWWAWWLVRAGALIAVIVGFFVLLTDFYKYPVSNCTWCHRLSCLPIKDWCSVDRQSFPPS
ncbi:hypothetical protein VTN49DRAFT_1329 [Thermomyces lanuginosus]|uniref:uncharacterized protein n=1 Tax=Thermomyces lanuginosus TaxID=5541 RepID=UPI003741ED68